jgi:carbon-monoxide dehydrogenase medium subunit
MKFVEPSALAEAVEILANESDARCLAGGATLVAMMNAELVEPSTLVGLRRIDDLRGITMAGDHIRIGAMTTHAEIAADPNLTGNAAVIKDAAEQIAHPAIRNMGTIGGSICHADPAADFPGALTAADVTLEATGSSGIRQIPIEDFFLDYLETALQPGEILTAIRVPRKQESANGRHLKFARTHGDYATVSVSVVLEVIDTTCSHARIALGSVAPTPLHLRAADETLQGSDLSEQVVARAGALLADAADPIDDVRGSAEYRRRVIPGLLARAIREARDRA